jgi:MFS family permease
MLWALCALFLDGITQVMIVGWGLPSLLRSRGVPTQALLSSLTIATAVQAAATLLGGWLGDRVGRRKLYCLASLALGLGTWFYFHALFRLTSATRLYPLYAANILYLGVAYGVLQGAFPALLVEIFPGNVRYSGVSFLYHVSRVYSSGIWPYLSRALLAAGVRVGTLCVSVGVFWGNECRERDAVVVVALSSSSLSVHANRAHTKH